MKPFFPIGAAMLAALALTACDSRNAEARKDAQSSPVPNPTPALREETKQLEGAAAVGIDSKQLRKKVDGVLDLKDERDRKLKETIKTLEDQ